jgi:hypothetical protein
VATTLLTAGIACIVAAIVGGGLKAFGLEIPVLASSRRQAGLGAFGLALLAAAAVASGGGSLWRGEATVAGRPANSSGGDAAASSDCFASSLGAVAADRLERVESGTAAFQIAAPNERKDVPMAVVIEDRRRAVGAIAFEFFAGSDVFKIDRVVDADCRPVEAYRNSSRGGDKSVLQNWDSVETTLGGATYSLRVGYADGRIEGTLTSVTP